MAIAKAKAGREGAFRLPEFIPVTHEMVWVFNAFQACRNGNLGSSNLQGSVSGSRLLPGHGENSSVSFHTLISQENEC